VWKPQIVWEPRMRRYEGKVNMHLPDAWGLVEFAPEGSSEAGDSVIRCAGSTDAAHAAAMNVYYAQHAAKERHGCFASSVESLSSEGLVDEDALAQCQLSIALEEDGFVATARDLRTDAVVSVTDTRYTTTTGQQRTSIPTSANER
jgi:hypothetical protein